ncbi:MAG: hypothetical protein A2X61_15425 [Ignavibacteria bacterium GWB2_35_12]|nr:MAG: hypothetical protein A2X61_15425 [Ignavibacteria bacterium GWB2_35_12]OGU88537.1 MAG: hypothetical protein A2220_06360 [Ignavibacteria bacterium RIFOXYA2_FULL_35_10]OGV20287.1 MAG: hypothetical protein A2475_12380 [Ignavibacteria bacterium RIFOXYC2_FULL_35_21]
MEAGKNKSIIVTKPSLSQMKDTGMAFTLICLLIGLFTGSKVWQIAGISLLFLDMLNSRLFYIPAILWFSLSNILGYVSSKILLTLIFFLIITPIGLIRRLLRSIKGNSFDSLKLKQWKKSKESVFRIRNHKFSKNDLINPY